jgi:hypothetical protein
MNPLAKRILNIVGIASAVAVGILVPILAGLPAGSTWTVRAGIAVAILSTLQRALGTAPTDGAKPADELAQTKVFPLRSGSRENPFNPHEEEIRKPDSGAVSLGVLVALTVFLFATLGIVYASHAADPMPCPQLSVCSGAWAAQPAAAVGWVANLKSGDVEKATSLIGVSVVRRSGITLGVSLLGGSVFSTSEAHPMLAALFSIANFGAIGPGVVMLKNSDGKAIYQTTLTVALNFNFGGSPSYVQAVAK